ncbi:hypothetical protein LZD49_04820 [Dyadobacter sp. CY261]|uniref:hypothetical protein n=1 Tax=Dyadobacter sp. CY261 TaxID=2907203 RepID=UPI001F364094|nr:hypothetical protein [Dyadobacter sp. CY261]MCF0069783.1 hypothetical protein [Dyadobacter sp. CY261]
MDLKELVNSIQKIVLKVSFVFFWIIIIWNIGVVLLSDKIGSEKLEALGGILLAFGVGFLILQFVRYSIRNK